MQVVCLHSKAEIEPFLRQHTFLHLYEIGDLDDFFWEHTTWFALKDRDEIRQTALIYTGTSLPVLLGFAGDSADTLRELLQAIMPFLPRRLDSHVNPEAVEMFANDYRIESRGPHYKMALVDRSRLQTVDTSEVVPLSVDDWRDLETLYRESYPGNWFDPRMLQTGCYFGVRRGARIVSVAGIHVYSPQYRVAVPGNITTHPDFRNQGLSKAVCAKLCQSLSQTVDHIGLNVKADNDGAIAVYQQLGFERIATYEEIALLSR